jgi:hypothetical protein
MSAHLHKKLNKENIYLRVSKIRKILCIIFRIAKNLVTCFICRTKNIKSKINSDQLFFLKMNSTVAPFLKRPTKTSVIVNRGKVSRKNNI